MKLGSLFDGSGGFPLAGVICGIEPVWASEIEPFPIRVTTKRFPNVKHLGSVTDINGAEIEPVDIITFGSPCFPVGTLVNTSSGLKPIESVRVGDVVLSHTGNYQPVINAKYTGHKEIYRLRAMGIDHIDATPNHRFLVRKKWREWDSEHKTNVRKFAPPEWVELKDIVRGDYISVPVIQTCENPLELTHEECWLVGRYIADGYIRDAQRVDRPEGSTHNTVVFCVGNDKRSEFLSHLSEHKAGRSVDKGVTKFAIHSSRLVDLCRACGEGAENKQFPQYILNLDRELLKTVIDGYMSGDGSFANGKYRATTISRKLAYTLGAAVVKAYRAPYSLYRYNVPETTVIEGRTVHQRTQYQIVYKTHVCKQDKAFYEDGAVWIPVNSVTPLNDKEAVYDITVANDHSFCVTNVAVHNCQDLSVAGKRAGLHDGERSSLFFEAIRIIKEMRAHDRATGRADVDCRPRYIVWENVFGAFSSNKGEDFRCVLEEICKVADPEVSIPRPDKGKWEPAGCIVGGHYSVAWRTFDAQYWGVPQRRRRIYLVADFAGQRAGEILFEQDGVRGNSAESGAQREGAAADAERGAGGSGGDGCVAFHLQQDPISMYELTPCIGGQDQASVGVVAAFKGGQGSAARTIGYDENAAPTLNATPSGSNQVPDVVYALQSNGIDRADTARCNGAGWREDQCYTLNTIDRHAVAFDCRNLAESQQSGTLQAKPNGGWSLNFINPACYPDVARTLSARHDSSPCVDRGQETVVIDRAAYNQGENAQYAPQYSEDGIVPTVIAKGPSAVCYAPKSALDENWDECNASPALRAEASKPSFACVHPTTTGPLMANSHPGSYTGQDAFNDMLPVYPSPTPPRKYIVRRLTPVECARLQGFPDWWCVGLETPEPTEEDIAWAAEVWERWRLITSPSTKPKGRNQLIKWLKNPYSDAAEYKLWGNGIALPCAVRVMEGIVKEEHHE